MRAYGCGTERRCPRMLPGSAGRLRGQIGWRGGCEAGWKLCKGSIGTLRNASLGSRVGRLYDLEISLYRGKERADSIKSYFGLRSIALRENKVFINGRSVFQRLVLDQGFYPDGIYTGRISWDAWYGVNMQIGCWIFPVPKILPAFCRNGWKWWRETIPILYYWMVPF